MATIVRQKTREEQWRGRFLFVWFNSILGNASNQTYCKPTYDEMAPACDVAAICRNRGGTSIWTATEHQVVIAEDATSSAMYLQCVSV